MVPPRRISVRLQQETEHTFFFVEKNYEFVLSVFRAIRRKKSTNEKSANEKVRTRWRAPEARPERAQRARRAVGARRRRPPSARRGEEGAKRGEGKGEREAKERRASEVLATMKPDRNREHQRMYRY